MPHTPTAATPMNLDSRTWDARYGRGILAEHAPRFTDYIAITSPSAWAVVEPLLPHAPRALEFQRGMGEDYLEALIQRLPDAEIVLAIGGGNALDVGKVAAWKLGKPLVMVPTIVSTGAIFQAPVAFRRQPVWQFYFDTVAPEYLLLDFDVIAAAPPHLNRAGMGECICILGHVGSWRWWADNRTDGIPWDQSVADATHSWVRRRCRDFAAGLDADGRPNDESLRIASEVNRERYDVPTHDLKVSHSVDHTFVMAFEWVHGYELIHSEVVSLGALINAYVYEWGFDETKSLLDACQVRYRPADIGCTWDEIRAVLANLNELNDRLGHAQNWFHLNSLSDQSFQQMADAIDAP